MELRVLQYFLAVAREQSVTGAAEYLHLSQPTLSRQLKDLEIELGKQLFVRGNRQITLTQEGVILRKRAEEIMSLVQKTQAEVSLSNQILTGDIYIGAAETDAVRILAKAAKELQKDYPLIHFHISSGDAADVLEDLDKGLLDFGLIFNPINLAKFEYLPVPWRDTWGLLMQKDAPLAAKEYISPSDFLDIPLLVSRQHKTGGDFDLWLQQDFSKLNLVATYSLLYNASIMVEEGMGYALCFDKLINTKGSNLCFRPLYPRLEASMNIVWKKYQVFTKAAEKFIDKFQKLVSQIK